MSSFPGGFQTSLPGFQEVMEMDVNLNNVVLAPAQFRRTAVPALQQPMHTMQPMHIMQSTQTMPTIQPVHNMQLMQTQNITGNIGARAPVLHQDDRQGYTIFPEEDAMEIDTNTNTDDNEPPTPVTHPGDGHVDVIPPQDVSTHIDCHHNEASANHSKDIIDLTGKEPNVPRATNVGQDVFHLCRKCGLLYRSNEEMRVHSQLCSYPHKCLPCEEIGKTSAYSEYSYLRAHLNKMHAGEVNAVQLLAMAENMPFQCRICADNGQYQAYKSAKTLKSHLSGKAHEIKLHVDHVNVDQAQEREMAQHLTDENTVTRDELSETAADRYGAEGTNAKFPPGAVAIPCCNCGGLFATQAEFKQHALFEQSNYACLVCQDHTGHGMNGRRTIFNSRGGLTNHVRKYHVADMTAEQAARMYVHQPLKCHMLQCQTSDRVDKRYRDTTGLYGHYRRTHDLVVQPLAGWKH